MKEQNKFVKKEIKSKKQKICDITSNTKLEIHVQSKYQIQAYAISYLTTNCRHRSTGQKKKRKTKTTWQRIMKIVTVVKLNATALVIVQNKTQNNSTRMGFEPTRAEPNGLAVHRLNHTATSSDCTARLLRTKTSRCFMSM